MDRVIFTTIAALSLAAAAPAWAQGTAAQPPQAAVAQKGSETQNPNNAPNLNAEQIRQAQQALNQKGFNVGGVDGMMGPKTEAAIKQFQQKQRLNSSGQLDDQTLAALGVSSATTGQSTPGSQVQGRKPDRADSSFVTEAIQGDLSEIQMGKLAQQKGTSEQVKQFGNTLVTDHGANLDKAKSLAQSEGITAPSSPNDEQKAMYDRLSRLSGDQFDKQFAKEMVEDHQKDIAKFRQESSKSGPVAEFAKDTLPTLNKHLEIAQSLNSAATTGSPR